MIKFKDFARPLSVFQVLFKVNLIFKDFSRQSCILKYFSSLCEPCLLIWLLCGTQYGSNEGVIEAVNEYFGGQEKAFYFEGIRKLEQRWAKCIALKGDCIENYWSNFLIPW